MSSAPASLLPSTQRPIPLEARDDLETTLVDYKDVGYWVIKDPVGLQYHRLQPEQYQVLQLLDGQRNLEEIRDELKRQFPTLKLTLADVQHLVTDLHEKGLVYSQRPGQAGAMLKKHQEQKRKKVFNAFRQLLYLRLPGWDPEPTLTWLYPYVRWMFHPAAVTACLLLVVSSWILLLVQFETFRSRLPEFQQFFGWPNLIYLWLTLGIAKIIHEFGHGLTCRHFGGECHQMGLLLLVFMPCLYCDVTDSWMLPNKWQRIMIGGAGMYIEIILSALGIFVWWNTQPGLLHHLALNLFFVTTVTTVIFNANPLMRFDGYYMMADWLEIPNLRPKADKLVRDTFSWYCLGIESQHDPFMPETGKFGFVVFAIAAWLYRWVILISITIFLYTVLKPYDLQSIGITLAVVAIGSIVFNMVYNFYKILSAPRIEPMDYRKITISLVVFAALVAAILAVPIPWYLEAPFQLQPHNVHKVYTITPGRLTKLHVEPGQFVEQGELLAELANPKKQDEYHNLQIQERVQKARVALYHAMENVGREQVARDKLNSIREQLAEYRKQLQHLTITAPCDGRIIEPPHKPEPKLEQREQQLPKWHGTPLDPENRNCFLEKRTHLLSIAPDEHLEAVLLIDQGNRNDMEAGQRVELKFENLPHKTYQGRIEEVGNRHEQFAPRALSNKYGGALPTVTDSQGRERLSTTSAYEAIVPIGEAVHMLKPGMCGWARVIVDERSAGQWLWRYIRRTFHFRL